ncbi:MAG: hypothetical protein V1738_00975 [Patescibacteria group bacterium]
MSEEMVIVVSGLLILGSTFLYQTFGSLFKNPLAKKTAPDDSPIAPVPQLMLPNIANNPYRTADYSIEIADCRSEPPQQLNDAEAFTTLMTAVACLEPDDAQIKRLAEIISTEHLIQRLTCGATAEYAITAFRLRQRDSDVDELKRARLDQTGYNKFLIKEERRLIRSVSLTQSRNATQFIFGIIMDSSIDSDITLAIDALKGMPPDFVGEALAEHIRKLSHIDSHDSSYPRLLKINNGVFGRGSGSSFLLDSLYDRLSRPLDTNERIQTISEIKKLYGGRERLQKLVASKLF